MRPGRSCSGAETAHRARSSCWLVPLPPASRLPPRQWRWRRRWWRVGSVCLPPPLASLAWSLWFRSPKRSKAGTKQGRTGESGDDMRGFRVPFFHSSSVSLQLLRADSHCGEKEHTCRICLCGLLLASRGR